MHKDSKERTGDDTPFKTLKNKTAQKLDVVMPACNPSTWET
jgi:hypothetical protein